MNGLKDGIILCEFISKLQPVSVKKINESAQNWYQLENIGNFIKAIAKYRGKPHGIFEANDLFENIDHAQVQSALLALASMAKKKGNKVNVGVKYVEKRSRNLSQRSFEVAHYNFLFHVPWRAGNEYFLMGFFLPLHIYAYFYPQ